MRSKDDTGWTDRPCWLPQLRGKLLSYALSRHSESEPCYNNIYLQISRPPSLGRMGRSCLLKNPYSITVYRPFLDLLSPATLLTPAPLSGAGSYPPPYFLSLGLYSSCLGRAHYPVVYQTAQCTWKTSILTSLLMLQNHWIFMHAVIYRYVSTVCMYILYIFISWRSENGQKTLKGQCIHAVHKDVILPSLEFSGLCMTWSMECYQRCTVQMIYPSTAYSFQSFSLQRCVHGQWWEFPRTAVYSTNKF